MKLPLASVIVATLALVVGLFNLWYSVVRPWRRGKWASPAAALELLTYATKTGWETDERVVVTNIGPADMEDVTAVVRDSKGHDYDKNVQALWPKMPFPALYAGQTMHLKLVLHPGLSSPGAIQLRWRDGRRGVQERDIWLSYRRITQ